MERKHLARFLEFLIIGIFMGGTIDLIAIRLTTDEPFTLAMVVIVVLVAIPFAVLPSSSLIERTSNRSSTHSAGFGLENRANHSLIISRNEPTK